jgi:hypothetical protein
MRSNHLQRSLELPRVLPLAREADEVGGRMLYWHYSTIISPFMTIQCPGNVQR